MSANPPLIKTWIKFILLLSASTLFGAGISFLPQEASSHQVASEDASPSFKRTYDPKNIELSFIENKGQFPKSVRFSTQATGNDLFFTADRVLFNIWSHQEKTHTPNEEVTNRLRPAELEKIESVSEALELRLIGSNREVTITGEGEKAGKFNYLKGKDPRNWKTDLSIYKKIRYDEVYKNTDLVFYGNEGNIQYDFIVRPGSDPSKIRFSFSGAKKVKREASGDLSISADLGKLTVSRPVTYQLDKKGERQIIPSEFVANSNRIISFKLGQYDPKRELIIDPVLTYSTYLGGSREDIGQAIKVDAQGYVYITGTTRSANFPVSDNREPIGGDTYDAYVTKLNPQGTDIVYSTILGSGGDDVGYGIDVDSSGNAYVVGDSGFSNFPQQHPLKYTSSLFQTSTGVNAWVGAGGINIAIGAIAVAQQNSAIAYVGGGGGVYKTTDGGATWTAVNNGFANNPPGIGAIAVNPNDSGTVFAGSGNKVLKTVDGGANWTTVDYSFGTAAFRGITVDRYNPQIVYIAKGDKIYRSADGGVTWKTTGPQLSVFGVMYTVVNHPTIPGLLFAGSTDGIYRSLDSGLSWQLWGGGRTFKILFDSRNPSLIYTATLNGILRLNIDDHTADKASTNYPSAITWGIVQDPVNPSTLYAAANFNAQLMRSTDDGVTWALFNQGLPQDAVPTALGLVNGRLFAGINREAIMGGGFALKLNPAGDALVYSTLFGEQNYGVTIDASGRAYVAGSASRDFGLINPLRGYSGRNDGYVAIFSPEGNELEFSTYLGGTQDDNATDVALDPAGNIYVTGDTRSPDFPVIAPLQSTLRAQQRNAFVAKLAPNGSGVIYSTYYGGSINDGANSIFADPAGNAYITGATSSPDMPVGMNSGIQLVLGGGTDAFVAKLNPTGSQVLYSTYLGGTDLDIGHDVSITQSGEIVVAGETKSVDFPTYRSYKSKSPFTRSSDCGQSWRNDIEGLNVGRVNAIVAHPSIPGILLAATDKGIFRSTDGGDSWILATGVNTKSAFDIAYDPSNPSIAYAGTSASTPGVSVGGMYKSNDGGITWSAINNGISVGNQQIFAVAVDPVNTNIIYAGADGFNLGYPLYKSTNGGQSWVIVGSSTISNISDIAVDPANTSVLYATSDGRTPYAFRSSDGGSNWSPIAPPGVGRGRSIILDPSDHTRVYLGYDGGIVYSLNQGATWQTTGIASLVAWQLSADRFQPTRVYAATSLGLYLSNDRGITWQPQPTGQAYYKELITIASDSLMNGVVYAGAIPYGDVDAFVSKIAPSGTSFQYSTLLGSAGDPNGPNLFPLPLDYAYGISLLPDGSVFATGYTRKDDFPTTPGAVSNHFSGLYEAFAVQFDESRKIFGKVTDGSGNPLTGVTLELIGSPSDSQVTLLDGRYRFNHVLKGGNFVLTPRKPGYSFTPENLVVNNLQADFVGNFVAISSMTTISGRITQRSNPVGGATVSITGSSTYSQQTLGDGTYSVQVATGGDYTVKPSKAGLIFDPDHQQVLNIRSNAAIDFAAKSGFVITGGVFSNQVGLAGIPVSLSGSETQNAVTDANGQFSFSASAGGYYSVTAASPGFTFAPPFVDLPALSSPQQVNFNAVVGGATNGKIAFVSNSFVDGIANLDIFTFPGSDSTNLTRNLASDTDPVWSPDGSKIAFASNRDGNWEIYVMNADGSNQTRITNDPAIDNEPTWSPDSSRIAFVKMPESTSSAEIYVINADGTNESRLTTNSWYEYSPAWSPDGTELAFVSEQNGNAEIYLMDINGGIRRRLTNNPAPDRSPAWSPDASWIAFDSGVDAAREIWKMHRDGSGLTQLTNGQFENRSPSYSADGGQIVFVTLCPTQALATVDANGGVQTLLTSCDQLADEPSWQSVRQGIPPFATVTGRITGPAGAGISNAYLTITDSRGVPRILRANPFGYYRFVGVSTAIPFTISVSSKQKMFSPSSRQLRIVGDMADVNFVSQN